MPWPVCSSLGKQELISLCQELCAEQVGNLELSGLRNKVGLGS